MLGKRRGNKLLIGLFAGRAVFQRATLTLDRLPKLTAPSRRI
jgi:hypothetical protein